VVSGSASNPPVPSAESLNTGSQTRCSRSKSSPRVNAGDYHAALVDHSKRDRAAAAAARAQAAAREAGDAPERIRMPVGPRLAGLPRPPQPRRRVALGGARAQGWGARTRHPPLRPLA
jgi:hypothetical protein